MTVTDLPSVEYIKDFEVVINDGHEDHKIRVRKDWFTDRNGNLRKTGDLVEILTTKGDMIVGEFVSWRPVREGK